MSRLSVSIIACDYVCVNTRYACPFRQYVCAVAIVSGAEQREKEERGTEKRNKTRVKEDTERSSDAMPVRMHR